MSENWKILRLRGAVTTLSSEVLPEAYKDNEAIMLLFKVAHKASIELMRLDELKTKE